MKKLLVPIVCPIQFANLRFSKGFTLLETLISGVFLAVALSGVVAMLRLSDISSLQAQAQARVSQLARSKIERITTMPYDRFVAEYVDALSSSTNVTTDKRFLMSSQLDSLGESALRVSAFSGCAVLLEGKVAPGGTSPAELGRYRETFMVTPVAVAANTMLGAAGGLSDYDVSYSLEWWIPGVAPGTYDKKVVDFTFKKLCPYLR